MWQWRRPHVGLSTQGDWSEQWSVLPAQSVAMVQRDGLGGSGWLGVRQVVALERRFGAI